MPDSPPTTEIGTMTDREKYLCRMFFLIGIGMGLLFALVAVFIVLGATHA